MNPSTRVAISEDVCVCVFARTPLMLSVGNGHLDSSSLLISLGANVHAVDANHRTALHRAVSL